MNIVALVKCVPDTETRVAIDGDGRSLADANVKWVVNPYDEFALEEAVRTVEARGEGTVMAVSVAGVEQEARLRDCLARGADRAILITDPAIPSACGLATARVLAAACRKLEAELVFAGRQGVGTDRSQVGPMVAELLQLPHAGVVTEIEIGVGRATCKRQIEGGYETIVTSLPALITAQKGLNEPRYAKIKEIMKAKKKPLERWSLADVDLAAEDVAAAESWVALELPSARPEATFVDKGSADATAAELVRLLSVEQGVI